MAQYRGTMGRSLTFSLVRGGRNLGEGARTPLGGHGWDPGECESPTTCTPGSCSAGPPGACASGHSARAPEREGQGHGLWNPVFAGERPPLREADPSPPTRSRGRGSDHQFTWARGYQASWRQNNSLSQSCRDVSCRRLIWQKKIDK